MNIKLTIASEQIRNRAALIMAGLAVDGTDEVIVQEHKRNRSAEQNSIYWKWLTVIGNDLRNTKDEQHDIYKRMFLIPIFTRDNQGFADMMASVDGMNATDYDIFSREILKLTSTTQASVKQMSEFLDDIQYNATSLGIRLPAPEYK